MARFEGGCLCGAIRYRGAAAPLGSIICHCRTCRKAHAAAAVPWITVPAESLSWILGKPALYRSSPRVVRHFCPACGAQLTYARTDTPATLDITTLSLDDPEAFPPTAETWLEHKLRWQCLTPGLAQFQKGGD